MTKINHLLSWYVSSTKSSDIQSPKMPPNISGTGNRTACVILEQKREIGESIGLLELTYLCTEICKENDMRIVTGCKNVGVKLIYICYTFQICKSQIATIEAKCIK